MSRRSHTGAGESRGQMDSDNRREYETDNPHNGTSDAAFSCSSNGVDTIATDIFRDHGFEESLRVPQERVNRLSFHDLDEADPIDVPLPLNIRKTSTPSSIPQKQEYQSVEDSTDAYSENTPTNQMFDPASAAGNVFSTSQIREVGRDEEEHIQSYSEAQQSTPPISDILRSLPRLPRGYLEDDTDVPNSGSAATFETISFVERSMLRLSRSGSRENQTDDKHVENQPVKRTNTAQHVANGYMERLQSFCGDPSRRGMPIESERARPPINLMGIGRGEARQATYAMDPYQPLYAEGSRAEESPPDRAAYYRYYLAKRRAELDSSDSDVDYAAMFGIKEDVTRDEGNLDEGDLDESFDNNITSVDSDNRPGTASLRPNLQRFPPTRIPRPIRRMNRASNLRDEQDERDEPEEEHSVSGVIPEEGANVEGDVPEDAVAQEDKTKGKAPAKKTKVPEQYDADPWSLMVTGSSTPRRSKKSEKKSETQRESHCSKPTPSSRHSKNSEHSDQPSSSDKRAKKTRRGFGKPSPIKSVFRVASGILPKFIHSPSTRSKPPASESHKDSNSNSNRNSDNNTTQEQRKQHSVTTASSSSPGKLPIPPTSLRSATVISPTPFRACSRPELGFPSSPRYRPRGKQASFFSNLPESAQMEPPTRPPPPIPHTEPGAQVTSNEVATAEDTPRPSTSNQNQVEENDTSASSIIVPETSSSQYPPTEVATEEMTAEDSTREGATDDAASQEGPLTQHDTVESATPDSTSCNDNQASAPGPQTHSTESTVDEDATEQANRDGSISEDTVSGSEASTDEASSTNATGGATSNEAAGTAAEDSASATAAATGPNATETAAAEVSSAQVTSSSSGSSNDNSGSTSAGGGSSAANSEGNEEEESSSGDSGEGSGPGMSSEERADSWETVDFEVPLPRVARVFYQAVDELSPEDRLDLYRRELGCEYVEWTPDQNLPMRPGDDRVWYSNNIRCEECTTDCCVCGRPCCMWKGAEQVLCNDLAPEYEKKKALRLLQRLQRVLPFGVDPRSHVLCSSPGGCGLFVCPYCCGRCSTAMCRDIQCLNCKEDPWGPCEWHPED